MLLESRQESGCPVVGAINSFEPPKAGAENGTPAFCK